MPIGSTVHPETMQCLIDLKTALDTANAHGIRSGQGEIVRYTVVTVGGMPVAQARNAITKQALDIGADFLLWIDSDMTFSPDVIPRLLARKLPIVGGLCFSRHPPSYAPTLLRYHDKSRHMDNSPMGFLYDFPPNDLVEVDATGGAFLLVARKVYEQIPVTHDAQWWTETREPGFGAEDVSFCLRARRAGFKIFVDTGCRVGHRAHIKIDVDVAERLRGPFRANQWIPPELQKGATTEPDKAVATIIIPTFNTPAGHLEAAVNSAIEQTVPVEVIVIDDGSYEIATVPGVTDGLVKLIRHDVNKGIAEALNTGFREATTDWLCWVSSDDLISPEKVERQLLAALTTGSKAVFHNYSILVDANNEWQMPKPPLWYDMDEQQRLLATGCHINGSTTMIHKSVFQKVGLYKSEFRYSQDWEMWNRIGQHFLWHYLPENLGLRRETLGNLTAKLNAPGEANKARGKEDAKIRQIYGAQY
jgi:glycosyltransferase involved in cell wall biosynthesis